MQEFINAFSKKQNEAQLVINAEVKIMRAGLAEALYMVFKEEQGDMDAYLLHVNNLHKGLIDGYYDFNGDNGQPVPRFKSNKTQHEVLTAFINKMVEVQGEDLRFDLSIEGLQKLADRRENRKKLRYLSSGSSQQRMAFEGTKPQLEYAGHMDDRGNYSHLARN